MEELKRSTASPTCECGHDEGAHAEDPWGSRAKQCLVQGCACAGFVCYFGFDEETQDE